MTRSHCVMTTSMSCSIMKNVLPLARRSLSRLKSFFVRVGVTPATGSSRRTSFGAVMTPPATAKEGGNGVLARVAGVGGEEVLRDGQAPERSRNLEPLDDAPIHDFV